MHARGKTFRKISLTKRSDRNDNTQLFLPFPISSISTILLVLVLLSTLSALYIGANRNHHATVIDLSSVAVTTSDTIIVNNERMNHKDGSSSASNNNNNNNDNNNNKNNSNEKNNNNDNNGPTIRSFQDLSPSELHPQAGPHRHIVSPPPDEIPVTLVTCSTTVGYLHVMVHPSWAPLGAQRFLQMVNSNYFSTKVVRNMCDV